MQMASRIGGPARRVGGARVRICRGSRCARSSSSRSRTTTCRGVAFGTPRSFAGGATTSVRATAPSISSRLFRLRSSRRSSPPEPTTAVSDSVIDVSELTRRFGTKTALAAVSLSLPRGAVYGLVGANGAGKTTLIKHILGLLRAERGSVRVFGLDPVADPVGVLSRIGYLSEENDLPGWMQVDELIRYSRAFYPAWDH